MWGKPKYRNIKTEIHGIKFDSKHEAQCYLNLKRLEAEGKIFNLQLQVKFKFPINGVNLRFIDSKREMSYVADFVYFNETGQQVVADAKGFKTPEYKIKKALMLACNGVFIEEI